MPCGIILDLIPLVKDNVASEESKNIVAEHIKICDSCRSEFEMFESSGIEQSIKDEKILSAIRRSIFITQIAVLIVGTIIGIGLTGKMGMFYNFIIMPVIGIISFITLRRKSYIAPIFIFILTYLWQVVTFIIKVKGEFDWRVLILQTSLFYSLVYTGLVTLGIIIAILLNFSFRKEGIQYEK